MGDYILVDSLFWLPCSAFSFIPGNVLGVSSQHTFLALSSFQLKLQDFLRPLAVMRQKMKSRTLQGSLSLTEAQLEAHRWG